MLDKKDRSWVFWHKIWAPLSYARPPFLLHGMFPIDREPLETCNFFNVIVII
jgi:hypothetical protein